MKPVKAINFFNYIVRPEISKSNKNQRVLKKQSRTMTGTVKKTIRYINKYLSCDKMTRHSRRLSTSQSLQDYIR
jgi:hypothetical protein